MVAGRHHSFVAIPVMLFAAIVSAAPEEETEEFDAMTSVQDTMAGVSGVTGSAQTIQENLAKPFMGEGQMSTFDGQTFDAGISCTASNSFMEVMVIPGVTGDITTLRLTQDKDMDGTPERLYEPTGGDPSRMISGVCSNGVMSCTPGSWDNCDAYAWGVNANKDIVLNAVHMTDLGGCYCVNNHCGTNLVTSNLTSILDDLGGGAAAALMAADARYTVTRVAHTGPLITFFGQKTSLNQGAAGCAESSGDLIAYYQNPGSLNSDAFAAATTAPADPVLPGYGELMTSPVADQDAATFHHCDINRNMTVGSIPVDEIIHFSSGEGGVSFCGPDCVQLTLGRIGDNYWDATTPTNCELFSESTEFEVIRPSSILSATLDFVQYDDWMQVRARNDIIWSGPEPWNDNPVIFAAISPETPLTPSACERTDSLTANPGTDFTAVLQHPGTIRFDLRVAVGDKGEGYATALIRVDTDCGLSDDVIQNHCAIYENDDDCTLLEETVDGVITYQDYVGTGLSPLPAEHIIANESCSIPVTRDWWQKQRTYRCLSDGTYDFTEALARTGHVLTTTTETGYEDRQLSDDGSVSLTTESLPPLPDIAVPGCTLGCKTRKERPATDASLSGVIADRNTLPTVYDYFYHVCEVTDPDAPLCPADAGESLVTDCSCIDEFDEVTSVIQAVRQAGKDLICSTGIPSKPPLPPSASAE